MQSRSCAHSGSSSSVRLRARTRPKLKLWPPPLPMSTEDEQQFEQSRSRDLEKEDALVNAKAEVMAGQRTLNDVQARLEASQKEVAALQLRAAAAERTADEHKRKLDDTIGESSRQLGQGSQDLASLQKELKRPKQRRTRPASVQRIAEEPSLSLKGSCSKSRTRPSPRRIHWSRIELQHLLYWRDSSTSCGTITPPSNRAVRRLKSSSTHPQADRRHAVSGRPG